MVRLIQGTEDCTALIMLLQSILANLVDLSTFSHQITSRETPNNLCQKRGMRFPFFFVLINCVKLPQMLVGIGPSA